MGHSLLAPGGLEVAQAVMGVCPQFDVLWDELSGREHMYIYGCIKGLPSKEVGDCESQEHQLLLYSTCVHQHVWHLQGWQCAHDSIHNCTCCN